ncbi:MAG: hypothetical protein ABSB88_18265 [Bryobacteraceae bacterium]|jgi:hypothetical protein
MDIETVLARVFLAAGLLTAAGCGSSSRSTDPGSGVPAADSAGGVIGTGPAFDWEKTPSPQAGNADRMLEDLRMLHFSSAKTLAETTSWLKQVLEQYQYKQLPDDPPNSATPLSDIKFQGCLMQWTTKQTFDGGMNQDANSLNLGDLDLGQTPGNVMVQVIDYDLIRLNTVGEKIGVTERNYDSGPGGLKLKAERTNPAASSELHFRDADFMAIRAAYAFVHAARRCGAKPPPGANQ